MKKSIILIFVFFVTVKGQVFSQATKTISDCTITYDVTIEDSKADPQVVKSMAGTTKVVYIKGSKSRNDLISSGFKQTTLYDIKSDSTIVLREIGNNKYITYLDKNKRNDRNKKYEGIKYSNTNERKTILGYDCIKVVAQVPNGSSYDVFYAPAVNTTNNEYEFQFKDLPGLVLEYEAQSDDGKVKVKYSATKITLTPVPVGVFDIPKSGFRVL